MEPLADKWRAFNWNVLECDGHSIAAIAAACEQAAARRSKPTVIIAHTVKGKGVSFMETPTLALGGRDRRGPPERRSPNWTRRRWPA